LGSGGTHLSNFYCLILKNNPLSQNAKIVCFGEILWDVLPTKKIAGGAPMNVAFHASNFRMDAQLISSVGQDALGQSLLDFLKEKNIKTDLVAINKEHPTSTVQVSLNERGSASYEIVQPVAWDFIGASKQATDAVSNSNLFVFGSLACRSPLTKETLFQLMKVANTTVFDVNLRAPFYTRPTIEYLLTQAQIVKMNDEELAVVSTWKAIKEDLITQMKIVTSQYDIDTLVVTEGKHGAYCLHKGTLYRQSSFPIKVVDTIGAGDAFLAAFLSKMQQGDNWQNCLQFACAAGALVATHSGGTPVVHKKNVEDFISKNTTNLYANA